MAELKIIDERTVLNKDFRIYGDFENPLFLAKDVAEWIEHSNPSKQKTPLSYLWKRSFFTERVPLSYACYSSFFFLSISIL